MNISTESKGKMRENQNILKKLNFPQVSEA